MWNNAKRNETSKMLCTGSSVNGQPGPWTLVTMWRTMSGAFPQQNTQPQ